MPARASGSPTRGHGIAVAVRSLGRAARGLVAAVVLLALLAGLPWALVRFVASPLPDHVPSWDEIEATLLNPMSAQFLLNSLAVMCWFLWFVFAIDVMRCAIDIARGITWPRVHAPGPVHGLAAALTGTIVLTLLGSRTAHPAIPPPTSPTSDIAPVVATAPLTPGAVDSAQHTLPKVDRTAPAPPGMVRVIDEVRLPQDGVHDCLWRIAERIYGPGGGSRWPELYQLNRGIEQPDGRELSNPNLVRPGWKIMAFVPATNQTPPDGHEQEAPPEQSAPSTSTEPAPPPSPTQEDRSREQSQEEARPGLNLVTGAFVSVGLAAAVTAAVVSARMWRRRRYRIGSGDRSDLQRPIAPVVRALRAADQRDEDGQQVLDDVGFVLGPDDRQEPVAVRVGVRGDRELAVSLAGTHGLGLAGAGATAAARALLLHLVAQPQHPDGIRVIVPADDFHHVFEGVDVDSTLSSVIVVDSVDAALDEMEAALLTRTRRVAEENVTPTALAPLVLLASPAPHAERRLQAMLDNGSVFGLAGIVLGQWRPGTTVLVRDDGTVRAASPGRGDALTGARLFSLPAADANDLLAVFRDAEDPADQPPTAAVAPTQVEPAWPPASDTDSSGADLEAATTTHDEQLDTGSPRPRLSVSVMGRVQVTLHGDDGDRDVGGTLTPKQREVLVFLALHLKGVRREVLNEAVWPNSRPPRPYNSFHNTLSLLRRSLSEATGGDTRFILNEDGRYRLNSELVTVDFWKLQEALRSPSAPGGGLTETNELYRGDLAEDVTAPWAEPIRESVRRDVLDALSGLISTYSETEPELALALLERTRKLDPYNEGVYCSLLRLQARLGRYDAIPRAVALLTTTLEEIGERPSSDILNLADFLQRRGNTRRPSNNAAAS
ncbi:BTAD domain-containing putative transcriptional regulator [Actinophytocola sp. KF-1]